MVALARAVGNSQFELANDKRHGWIVPRCRTAHPRKDVTGVAAGSSPTVRRRELGARLRTLRNEHGLTVEQVAEELLCSPSKVSRMETGQRGVTARDIRDLARLYDLDDAQQQQLTNLAAEGKQRAWWQPFALRYGTYVGLEAEASLIRDFGLGLIPGLLQTPDYARAVLHATVPHHNPSEIEHLVEARMARQERALSGHGPPDLYAILDISVLYRIVGGRAVMRRQLERLLEVSQLPHIKVRVIPYEAGVLPVATNKFIILNFARPGLSDVVFLEGVTGDLYLDRSEDIELYNIAFQELEYLAASTGDTRAIIAALINSDEMADQTP
jgi:transcriptional regulator with XRE-family HTH domain